LRKFIADRNCAEAARVRDLPENRNVKRQRYQTVQLLKEKASGKSVVIIAHSMQAKFGQGASVGQGLA
jgi:hypothetical protein